MDKCVIGINRFFDLLWTPLSKSPWYVDFIIISAISALVFLIVFKKTSNQEMIRLYKNKIFAQILEIRLYKDQPVLTIKIVFSILGYNLIYLRYMLTPLIAVLPIFLIFSVQLNNRYGYSPMEKDQRFIIRADLDRSAGSYADKVLEKIKLEVSDGIMIETPPMRVMNDSSIFWRAKVIGSNGKEQFCRIWLDENSDALEKKVFTARNNHRFSPKQIKWNLQALLINNAEDFLPQKSPFKSVAIYYNRSTYPFLTWELDPVVLYFILTLLGGLLFKHFLNVNI